MARARRARRRHPRHAPQPRPRQSARRLRPTGRGSPYRARVPDGAGVAAGASTEADREKAQQDLANSIEAETVILRQRIVELTAMVERMQLDVQAQEIAQRAADAAATLPPPVPPAAPESDWWEANASLVAAIVGLPLLIAAGLLWKRRRDAARDNTWRPASREARAPQARPAPGLRNAPAGLARMAPDTAAPALEPKPEPVKDAGGSGLDTSEPVDIDRDLVDHGKLDLAPRTPGSPSRSPAPVATRQVPMRARKPMPPDPAGSARPVQQPISVRRRPRRKVTVGPSS